MAALGNKEIKIYGDLDEYTNRLIKTSVKEHDFECGIVYYDLGIPPQTLFIETESIVFMGFEKWLICIDCKNKVEKAKRKMAAAFYEFLEIGSLVVAVCELDIHCFDRKGNLIWSSGLRNVVENYTIINDKDILITCSDGRSITLELRSGKTV